MGTVQEALAKAGKPVIFDPDGVAIPLHRPDWETFKGILAQAEEVQDAGAEANLEYSARALAIFAQCTEEEARGLIMGYPGIMEAVGGMMNRDGPVDEDRSQDPT